MIEIVPNGPAPDAEPLERAGDLIGEAYQLAGQILFELPEDPRHGQLLSMIFEVGELLDREAKLKRAR